MINVLQSPCMATCIEAGSDLEQPRGPCRRARQNQGDGLSEGPGDRRRVQRESIGGGCGVISANAAVCSAHPGSGPQHHRGDPQRRTAAQETCRVLAERVVVYCLCFPSDAEVVGLLGRGCCSSAARRFVSFLNSPYSLHVSLVPEPCGLLGWARYE